MSVERSFCGLSLSKLIVSLLLVHVYFAIQLEGQGHPKGKTGKKMKNGKGKGGPVILNEKDLLNKNPHLKKASFETLRSFNDKKDYAYDKLENGLEVLFVSDPSLNANAASLSVKSGVKNEGEDIFGLAHYCEHMLFLGSKKYPVPTLFVDFITKNNGKFNGFTDFDTTGFFFKINKDSFSKAIDIFSQFFINPLFNATYVEKEVNSVNSEFERNIQLDRKRKEQVLRDNADPKSLFHRFSTGNNKTLLEYTRNKNISLRDRVIKYYNEHYRIDNMRLVIYGDKKIDEYRKLVNETFGQAKKPSKPYNFTDNRPLPYKFFDQGKLILFQTINDHQQLDISFMIPDIHKALPDNPSLYYRLLLNKKGKNSLSDILKAKGFLSSFRVGVRRTYDGSSMFKMNGFLTLKGIKEIDQVLKVIFQFLEFVKQESLKKEIYDYYRKALGTRFQYNHKKNKLMPFMKGMCVSIWKYPKKYLFSQHSLLPPFNDKKLIAFGKHLVIENAVIIVGHIKFTDDLVSGYNKFAEGFKTPIAMKQDNWYHTKYSTFRLTKDYMKSLLSKPEKFIANFLTEKSKPLPKNVSLVKRCKSEKDPKACLSSLKGDDKNLRPDQIQKDDFVAFYHKLDRSFMLSKVNFFVKFVFSKDVNDPKYATFVRLLVFSLNHHLRNYFHEEQLRQNVITINASPNGMSVKFYSFDDLIEETSKTFFKMFRELKLTEEEFNMIKDGMKSSIEGKLNLVPALQAYVNFFTLILKDFIHHQKLFEEIKKFTLEEFNKYYKEVFSTVYIKAFVHGALPKDKATKIMQAIKDQFISKETKKLTGSNLIDYSNYHADLTKYYVYREKLKNVYNINHAIINFYQIGDENFENIILANLVRELCGYIYFTELRIKQQLGYTTKGKVFSEGNVIYYLILIQGSNKTPEVMDVRIDELLALMRKRIEETSAEKFKHMTNLVLKTVAKNDGNLKQRTQRLWSEIITHRSYFNLNDVMKLKPEDVSKEDVLKFFDRVFSKQLQKLSVQEFSKKVEIPKEYAKVRGFTPEKVTGLDFFRKRGKFLKKFEPKKEEVVIKTTIKIS